MDEFLNLKNDNETEDEERAASVRDEVVTREGEGAETRKADAAKQGIEVGVKKFLLAALLEVSPIRDLEPVRLVLQKEEEEASTIFHSPNSHARR